MIGRFAIVLALLGAATPAHAQLFDAAPLEKPVLDRMRGGFDLPGGMIINLGVTTETRVDGAPVLRTTFNIDQGSPRLAVLAAQAGRLAEVTLTADGAALATADGTVRLRTGASGTRVELAGDTIEVSHLMGQAYGSLVANSGNDRAIDVQTTIDIGVSGIRPDAIGSSLVRAGNLALDATARLNR